MPSSSSSDLTLVVESESGTAEEFFAQVALSIGRAKSNTIHIDHPDVDRIHAKVVKRGDAYWLRAEPPAKLPLLDPEPGEVEETELFPGLSLVLGGVTLRCRRRVSGMGALSDDYWADAAGGERFKVEHASFNGDLPKKIGPYEIRKFVARGGMGIVLQGIHEDTAQPAAVKLPTPDLNKDHQWLKRFEQEVRTLKSVVHPNLVRLQDAGTEGELHWMAMDWVEGWTVGERLTVYKNASEPMPLQEIQLVLKQVVEGLVNLHAHGIVHRDLKPGNLLVGQDGGVKVADFGLAKQVGGEQSTVLTRTGTFAGTMHYMAPEQAEGMEITAATDVFALGVIWHELLTSRRPGRRLKIQTQRPDCPPAWAALIEQCLEDEPADRPALNQIKQALEVESFATPVAEAEVVETDSQARPSNDSPTDEPAPWRDEPASPPVQPEVQRIPAKPPEKTKPAAPSPRAQRQPQQERARKRESHSTSQHATAQPEPEKSGGMLKWVAAVAAVVAVAAVAVVTKDKEPTPPKFFTNTLGMKFVPVQGTEVQFCIWETRVKDYAAYAAANAGVDESWKKPEELALGIS
ncbi:MAG: protein kinase, partial [Verrucomicrobia subdivision 3 bacterium]|nr:protein kinase [Limisphaerales bacterium]